MWLVWGSGLAGTDDAGAADFSGWRLLVLCPRFIVAFCSVRRGCLFTSPFPFPYTSHFVSQPPPELKSVTARNTRAFRLDGFFVRFGRERGWGFMGPARSFVVSMWTLHSALSYFSRRLGRRSSKYEQYAVRRIYLF